MELDDIKKMWQEIDSLKEKQQINESRIKEMLKNEGKTALDRLIKLKKIGMVIAIPLGIFMCFISHKFFEAGGYYMIMPFIFLLYTILIVPFNYYWHRFLKGIDFSNMTVREVLERILKYQNMIQKFEMYGIIFGIIYLGIWYYLFYKLMIGAEIVWGLIIFMAIMCVVAGLLISVLYKKLYYNNINKIKESLKELKEFEEA